MMGPTLANSTAISRRDWLRSAAAGCAGVASLASGAGSLPAAEPTPARIAITLDLEMSRNFPRWEDTHWDFEKGNLDDATKRYALEAGRRVRDRGGRIHYFCVGRVLEQRDVKWLEELASAGHPIGNHTYDHVNLLAKEAGDLQFRFQRSPWLIEGRKPAEVIRENIRLTTLALKQRIGVDNRGFRAPGGFQNGLKDREDLQKILLETGFTWVSSQYPAHANSQPQREPDAEVYDSIVAAQAQAQPFAYPTGLIEIPMSPISDINAFRTGRWRLEWFLEAIRRAVAWTIERRAVFDFLAHPSCLVASDPEFRALDLICDLVRKSEGRATLVDLDTIARQAAGT
jgi:hypothetical protein